MISDQALIAINGLLVLPGGNIRQTDQASDLGHPCLGFGRIQALSRIIAMLIDEALVIAQEPFQECSASWLYGGGIQAVFLANPGKKVVDSRSGRARRDLVPITCAASLRQADGRRDKS